MEVYHTIYEVNDSPRLQELHCNTNLANSPDMKHLPDMPTPARKSNEFREHLRYWNL